MPNPANPFDRQPPQDIIDTLRLHDKVTAPMRAELARRSAAEKLYDDCLLDHLRIGKPFKKAMREANASFPTEALNPEPRLLAGLEHRYRFMLDMEKMDEMRAKLEESQREIEATDAQIASLIEQMTNSESKPDAPANPPLNPPSA